MFQPDLTHLASQSLAKTYSRVSSQSLVQTHTQTRNSCWRPEPQMLLLLLHTQPGGCEPWLTKPPASKLLGWMAPSVPPTLTTRGPSQPAKHVEPREPRPGVGRTYEHGSYCYLHKKCVLILPFQEEKLFSCFQLICIKWQLPARHCIRHWGYSNEEN